MTPDGRFLLVLLCFLLSGATALVYQTAWTREFAFVFGTSELAVATVLAAYMGGLTVGAATAARFIGRVHRPVLVYGLLELGIGVSAFLVPVALRLATPLYVALLGGSDAFDVGGLTTALFYVACSFAILMVPTAFMGATLPLLARHAVHTESQLGSRIGALYAINTTGAVIGTLLAGFVLLPRLGLQTTVLLAVAGNGVVFGLAVLASRGAPDATGGDEALAVPRPSFAEGGWVLPAILLSGVASFTYEVLWTRLLGHLLGGSVYAFATMLASFLIGIALGSAFAARRATTPRRAALGFAVAELGVALFAGVAFAVLDQLPDLARSLSLSAGRLVADATVAGLTLLPSTLCIGATFPFAVRILGRSERDAGPVSARVFAWNTVGAIVGALGGGFFALPALGYEGALTAASALNVALALAAALLIRPLPRRLVAAAVVAAAAVLLLRPDPPWRLLTTGPLGLTSRSGDVSFYAVGRSATVLLIEDDDYWNLTTNGLPESSILRARSAAVRGGTTRWLSTLPLVARPDARSMLVVGLGGGVVIENVPEGVESIDVVELEPKVVEANRSVAAGRMWDPLADPRVRVHENDARGALLLTDRRFDVIVSQPSHPWTAGASHLYTREFFELVRSRLTPDGVFSQWMGAQFVDAELLKVLLATLLDVFPCVRLYTSDPGSVVFLASNEPLPLEETVGRALADAPDAFAAAGIRVPEDVAAALLLDEEGARRFAAGAEVSTDDRNILRTRSPEIVRNLSRPGSGRKALDLEKTLLASGLVPQPGPGLDRLRLVRSLVRRRFVASAERAIRGIEDPAQQSVARARVAAARGAPGPVLTEVRKAFEQDPSSRDALAEALDLWRYGVQPGRDLARQARVSPDALPVRRGMEALDAKDFEALRALEPGLAALCRPGDPLAPAALRLRAAWRTASGEPKLAEEAVSMLDVLLGESVDRFDYLERARAAQAAGDAFGTLSSLQQVITGIQRRRAPPRLLEEARALLRTTTVGPELEPFKSRIRERFDNPLPARSRGAAPAR